MDSKTQKKVHNRERVYKNYRAKTEQANKEMLEIPQPQESSQQHSRFKKKMGYDWDVIDYNETKAMKWMKQDFNTKMVKYIGKGEKKSRMDKTRLKEQIGFTPQMNPLIKIFSRVNNKMEKGLKWDAFRAIKA